MHPSAMISGTLFAKMYGAKGFRVLDVGGQDFNGSLRQAFLDEKMEYVCVDIEAGKGVDVIYKPGDRLPFESGSFDLVISTSCMEHDPCFWLTFRDICRITKLGGFIYVNAPSNGPYHTYPGDNWRFYSDAGQALAYYAGTKVDGIQVPVEVQETFHIQPYHDVWIDFICVWKRVDEPQSSIVVKEEIRQRKDGLLRRALESAGLLCMSTMPH